MKNQIKRFAFISNGLTVSVIEAKDRGQARERAILISHLARIPANCKVKPIHRRAVLRCPVFFNGHFLAIEDALAGA